MKPYRAIPIDGKNFVYGWFCKVDDKHFIIPDNQDYCKTGWTDTDFVETFIEVIPESVGQQIGKQDENDKEIYGGDIIEYYSALVPKGTNPTKRQTVKWNKRIAGFTDCHSGGKVIGDIHTTPKLLEKL